jgi:hypothetical protein
MLVMLASDSVGEPALEAIVEAVKLRDLGWVNECCCTGGEIAH